MENNFLFHSTQKIYKFPDFFPSSFYYTRISIVIFFTVEIEENNFLIWNLSRELLNVKVHHQQHWIKIANIAENFPAPACKGIFIQLHFEMKPTKKSSLYDVKLTKVRLCHNSHFFPLQFSSSALLCTLVLSFHEFFLIPFPSSSFFPAYLMPSSSSSLTCL